jgi:virginiamycin B lyase
LAPSEPTTAVEPMPPPTGPSAEHPPAVTAESLPATARMTVTTFPHSSAPHSVAATAFTVGSFRDPHDLVAGPDGRLWVAGGGEGVVGTADPDGTVRKFSVPDRQGMPESITASRDGDLWFTEPAANKIGRVTTSGDITEVSLPTPNSYPMGIAATRAGDVWFNKIGSGVGRVAADGSVTEYATTSDGGWSITVDRDDTVWFTKGLSVGRITPDGQVTEVSLPCRAPAERLVLGPDGAIWVSQPGCRASVTTNGTYYPDAPQPRLVRITTGGAPAITEIATPGVRVISLLAHEGLLWFTGWDDNNRTVIGRFDVRSHTSTWGYPNVGEPRAGGSMAVGPDGLIWITANHGLVRLDHFS